MRISAIGNTLLYNKNRTSSSNGYVSYNRVYGNVKSDIFVKSSSAKSGVNIIPFLGYKVFLVDGGNHATNLFHFAKAISKDIDPVLENVNVIANNPNMKNLKDLERVLIQLPSNNNLCNQYIAVPASSSVPLLNLQDQVNRVMNTDVRLTPENIKANKQLLLSFLKKIYDNPSDYREYIGYMDSENQGIEYTYGVINQINNLIKKYGARVYLPAGHPFDQTMKWMAGQRNLKPELYNYIATGEDKTGAIKAMQEEIKNRNWYNFNLLTLSDAQNITIKNKGWNENYIFAGYDTCTTDGARGVYNFSPVRDENKRLVGYSYTDTTTNEYPYSEFPANDEVANLAEYVGLDADEVVANPEEISQFKSHIDNKALSHKLYPIEQIFSDYEIIKNKFRLRGDFVDHTKKLFFRKNNDNKIIFPYTDCEGSGKPSVLPMWGCCFAIFNAIKKDIYYRHMAEKLFSGSNKSYGAYLMKKQEIMNDILDKARNAYKSGNFDEAEKFYNEAVEVSKASEQYGAGDFVPYLEQGDMFFKLHVFSKASGCYNTAIAKISKNVNSYLSLNGLKLCDIKSGYLNSNKYQEEYQSILKISEIYHKIGLICADDGEFDSALRCLRASDEIKNFSDIGEKLIARRADHNRYIGDLI